MSLYYINTFLMLLFGLVYSTTSVAKHLLYILFALLFFGLRWFQKTKKIGDFTKSFNKRKLRIVLYGSIGLAYFFHAFLYLYGVSKLGLSIRTPFLISSGGVLDYGLVLIHSHIFKPSVTWIVSPLVQGLKTYGTGLTFLGFIPVYIYYIGTFLILLVFALFCIYFLCFNWGKYDTLLYSVFSFGILKSLLDGGPFWYETLLFVGFFFLLITDRKYKRTLYWGFFIYGIILLISDLLNFFRLDFFVTPMYMSALLILIFLDQGYILKMSKKAVSLVFATVLFANFTFTGLTAKRLLTVIPARSRLFVATSEHLDLEPLYREGDGYIVYQLPRTEDTGLLAQVTGRYGLNAFYQPIHISGQTCKEQSVSVPDLRVILMEGNVELTDTLETTSMFDKFSIAKIHNNDYSLSVSFKPCTSFVSNMYLPIVVRLHNIGFEKFILVMKANG